ncbi:hypothetical protein [Allokutzneria sp. NRRL B-24872]|uniref:hypothetical protein n=1 Tax=Allokutzneria sp. NRRL B-24872 TaxID=1137961 RepID=UPI000A361BA2|nr:hypothetical protein [Allokutzneria sp. NRRL B-24872]
MTQAIQPDHVRYALRSVRSATYEIGTAGPGTTLALVMAASPAGRRNAAEKIVGLLAAAGLGLAADDPVAALTDQPIGLLVVTG